MKIEGSRDWSDVATTKECRELPKGGKGKEWVLLRSIEVPSTVLLVPRYQPSDTDLTLASRTVRINFCCLKPSRLW